MCRKRVHVIWQLIVLFPDKCSALTGNMCWAIPRKNRARQKCVSWASSMLFSIKLNDFTCLGVRCHEKWHSSFRWCRLPGWSMSFNNYKWTMLCPSSKTWWLWTADSLWRTRGSGIKIVFVWCENQMLLLTRRQVTS